MTGRIVVGVDGSVGGRAALRWALAEAARRGAKVDAVHAWRSSVASGAAAYIPLWVDPAEEEAWAKAVLDDVVSQARSAGHAVVVHQIVAEGHPAAILVEAARGADLLVVGRRGHGGFEGLLLGSVSRSCLHHAPCPVVVVPGVQEVVR